MATVHGHKRVGHSLVTKQQMFHLICILGLQLMKATTWNIVYFSEKGKRDREGEGGVASQGHPGLMSGEAENHR